MPSTPPMAVATAIITLSMILQVDFPFCFSMGVMFLKVIHFVYSGVCQNKTSLSNRQL